MELIRLSQLIQYYDSQGDPIDRIQIVSGEHELEDADEMTIDSEFLKPFMNWIVTELMCVMSYRDQMPVLRVAIKAA